MVFRKSRASILVDSNYRTSCFGRIIRCWLHIERIWYSPFKVAQKKYVEFGMGGWNELESENKIIGPLIVSSRIDYKKFAYFL